MEEEALEKLTKLQYRQRPTLGDLFKHSNKGKDKMSSNREDVDQEQRCRYCIVVDLVMESGG